MSGTRTVIVPDTGDDDVLGVLRNLEEVLLALCWTGDPDYDIPDLPPLLAGRRPLEAVRRLMDALGPSQHLDDAPRPGRLLAPDGRYEHTPLVPVEVAEQDLALLAQTAQVLGAAGPHTDVAEVLQENYDHRATQFPKPPREASLVELVARLHGTLDLEVTDDVTMLLPVLRRAMTGDAVLTVEQEAAYQRTADRINAMLTGSALDRWAY